MEESRNSSHSVLSSEYASHKKKNKRKTKTSEHASHRKKNKRKTKTSEYMAIGADKDLNNFLGSNVIETVDLAEDPDHRKKKKRYSIASELENICFIGKNESEKTNIYCSDSSNHVGGSFGSDINNRRKRKKEKLFFEENFEEPGVFKKSVKQLHNSSNAVLETGTLSPKKKQKIKADKDSNNFHSSNVIKTVDLAKDHDFRKKKKKNKYSMSSELENDSFSSGKHKSLEKKQKTKADKDSNNFLSSNVIETVDLNEGHDFKKKRKKKKYSITSELENDSFSIGKDKSRELNINCSDSTNHLENVLENHINNGKKRKKENPFAQDKFKKPGVFVNSKEKSHNSLNTVLAPENLSHKKKQKIKVDESVVQSGDVNLNNLSSNVIETVDLNEDHDLRKKKKKNKYSITSELENDSFSIGKDKSVELNIKCSDSTNHIGGSFESHINNGKKRKKEKLFAQDNFEKPGVFVNSMEHSSLNALAPENLSHKKKQKIKAVECVARSADVSLNNLSSNVIQIDHDRKRKKKKETSILAAELENDKLFKKDKKEEISIHNYSDTTNHAENLFENHIINSKKKREKRNLFTKVRFGNIDISIRNSLNSVQDSNCDAVHKKKNHRAERDENYDLSTGKELENNFSSNVTEAVDLSEDCDVRMKKGKRKRNQRNVIKDNEFPVSYEAENVTFIENSIEPSENTFDSSLKLKSRMHFHKKNADENIANDLIEKLNSTEIDFSEECRFVREKKKQKKFKHSTPKVINETDYLFHNPPQLLKTVPDISIITESENFNETFPSGENDDVSQKLEESKFFISTLEKINLSSDDTIGGNKTNKTKRHKSGASDRASCEKVNVADDCDSVIGKSTLTPMKDLMESNLSPKKKKALTKQTTNDSEVFSENYNSEKSKKISTNPEDEFDLHELVSTSQFDSVLDNNEDPVNFTIPLLHEKESVSGLSKEDRALFESKGIKIKHGKWSKSEDDILKRNYDRFCEKFKVNDPHLLLGAGEFRRSVEMLRFLKAKHFYVRLGQDLENRPLHSIYLRSRNLFHPLRENKKCTQEEVSTLKKAHNLYGNSWHQIGCLLDKKASKIRESHRWNEKPVRKGKWTHEEEENLRNALKIVTNTSKPSSKLMKDIPWEAVAKLVPTRNCSQCRLHWGECMAWDPDVTQTSTWDKTNDEQLLEVIKNEHLTDESEIDWEDIHKLFKEVAPSYMFLQKRWRKLKRLGDNSQIFKSLS